ncbi:MULTISPECIES: CinA family protein [unclassified Ketobacter]|uniref:CinA family protein n=1 Tax=unclassified Ketobacter TaxID=2639109 RepID=UPI000F0FCF02|nr:MULTISPECIES: CinA family protein [unclassified Ketobacter]RLT88573.1 MAG: CinA family protein [Ketobacter sp. GenoA1]RLT97826.1 MAG: CinA family protein [Ketobacter sp.]
MLLYSDQVLLIEALATQLGALLTDQDKKIVTAESCTGGWVSQAITQVAGSSGWFDRAYISYSNQAKRDMLGVKVRTLNKYGAVSRAVVEEMAAGALKKSGADFSVAISGIAGPNGGTDDKPVGTVWLAWHVGGQLDASLAVLPGSRRDVRAAAVTLALQGLLVRIRRWLAEQPSPAALSTAAQKKELTQLLDDSE